MDAKQAPVRVDVAVEMILQCGDFDFTSEEEVHAVMRRLGWEEDRGQFVLSLESDFHAFFYAMRLAGHALAAERGEHPGFLCLKELATFISAVNCSDDEVEDALAAMGWRLDEYKEEEADLFFSMMTAAAVYLKHKGEPGWEDEEEVNLSGNLFPD